MSGGEVAEKIVAILDEIETRLKTDSRMPGSSSGFSISPLEVLRGERTALPNTYPIAYIVHGEITEDELTTRSNNFQFTVWIQVFIKERDPEIGTDEIMKYTLAIRRVFREEPEDKRLQRNGVALVRHVDATNYSWGAFQPTDDSGTEWEYGGLVQLLIEFSNQN